MEEEVKQPVITLHSQIVTLLEATNFDTDLLANKYMERSKN